MLNYTAVQVIYLINRWPKSDVRYPHFLKKKQFHGQCKRQTFLRNELNRGYGRLTHDYAELNLGCEKLTHDYEKLNRDYKTHLLYVRKDFPCVFCFYLAFFAFPPRFFIFLWWPANGAAYDLPPHNDSAAHPDFNTRVSMKNYRTAKNAPGAECSAPGVKNIICK